MRKVFWAFLHILTAGIIVSGLLSYFGMPTFARGSGKDRVTTVSGAVTFAVEQDRPDPNIIFDQVNDLRVASGLQKLYGDPILLDIAEKRADDMVARSYYAHKNPDGLIFYDLMKLDNTAPEYACENLALESSNSEKTYFDSWLLSNKGHRDCMLNTEITRAGYAVRKLYDVPMGDYSQPYYVVVAIHGSAN